MTPLSRRALLGVTATATATAAGVVGTSSSAEAGPRARLDAEGSVISTMDPANTGAENAAAFIADVAAAAGAQIVVPPGDTAYTVGQVEITGATINVRFMAGAVLVPDASLHAVGPAGRMFHATNCNTRLYGLTVEGRNVPENCWRSDGGQFRAYDTTMTNMGFLDLDGNTTSLGTIGIICKTVDDVVIDGYTGSDFVGKKDGVFANNAGLVRHLWVYECERVAIRNVTISGGEGEDNDFIATLDLRTPVRMHGTIENCHLYYNGQTRRCLKFQGGRWDVRDIHCILGADFVSVDPTVTDVGEQNLNCIDYAGSVDGEVRISDSFIDATGYTAGIGHTVGPLGKVIADNCTIIGSRRHAIRTNPEPPHQAQDIQSPGFLAVFGENESQIRNCIIKGFPRSVVVQGNRGRVTGNVMDDPSDLWFQGGSSVATDFLELSNNKVYTRTPDSMATGRCGRVDNYTNLEVRDNTLIRAGNTTHSPTFIDVLNVNAIGFAINNRAPAGVTAVNSRGADVAVYLNQGHLLRPLLTTTAVGNVTTGEGNLQTSVIPAFNLERVGAAVRTTFTGTTANNANAKTLRVYVGTSQVLENTLTPEQAGTWEVQIVLISLGTNAQKYTVRFVECGSAPTQTKIAVGTLTEVTGAPITLKTTGEGVATKDIVGEIAVSESLEGRHFVFT